MFNFAKKKLNVLFALLSSRWFNEKQVTFLRKGGQQRKFNKRKVSRTP